MHRIQHDQVSNDSSIALVELQVVYSAVDEAQVDPTKVATLIVIASAEPHLTVHSFSTPPLKLENGGPDLLHHSIPNTGKPMLSMEPALRSLSGILWRLKKV